MASPQLGSGSYLVFNVESGDRLTFLLKSTDQSLPVTKGIIITGVSCPKMMRGMTPDEPCAFDAFEFLCTKLIGKNVSFKPEFEIDPLKRTAGRVTLPDGEDAAEALLRYGLADFNERQPVKMDPERRELLFNLCAEAKRNRRGIWARDAAKRVRPVLPSTPADIRAFVDARRGREAKVRVDRVQNACALWCSTLLTHQPFLLHLTGVSPIKEGAVATESKFFTEKLLLQRRILVRFDGADPLLNILGSVKSPKGLFQTELVSRGFAKLSNSNISLLSSEEERTKIRTAEAAAMQARIGLWKGLEVAAPQPTGPAAEGQADPGQADSPTIASTMPLPIAQAKNDFAGPSDFDATLVQVISGDLVVVHVTDRTGFPAAFDGYVRLSLSGIRVARGNKSRDGNQSVSRVSYSDFSWEARELLRSRFIGHPVRVHIDYTRTIEESKELRPMATVIDQQTNLNIAAVVLEHGYGKFFLGRSDVCTGAAALTDAEAVALSNKAGIHDPSNPGRVTNVVELSRLGEVKGRQYLGFLQRGSIGSRAPLLKGIVDLVNSGSSYRVFVPREHLQIPFKLAGIASPQSAFSPGQREDPFWRESRDFAISRIQQREVEIRVDTSDRGGNFIGSIYLDGKDFAVQLLEAGLAVVCGADRLESFNTLVAAEKEAERANRHVWSRPGALPARRAAEEAEQSSDAPIRAVGEWEPVNIVNVDDGNTVTIAYDSSSQVRDGIAEAVKSFEHDPPHTSAAKNEMVVAFYREDKTWNRARIVKTADSKGLFTVFFIDFDSQGLVHGRDLRAIPGQGTYEFLRKTPATAVRVKIALLRPMTSDQKFCEEACSVIWDYAEQGPLLAKTEYTLGNTKAVTISVKGKETEENLAGTLCAAGLGLVDKRVKVCDPDFVSKLLEAQERARRTHKMLWQFGDIGLDEEDGY